MNYYNNTVSKKSDFCSKLKQALYSQRSNCDFYIHLLFNQNSTEEYREHLPGDRKAQTWEDPVAELLAGVLEED